MAAYMTVEEANTYMETYRLITSAWDAASATDHAKALAIATRMIDQLAFDGEKNDADQEQQFPRGSDTSVPTEVKEACAECAYSLLDGVDIELEYDNIRANTMGFANVRSSQNSSMVPEHKVAGIPSFIAWLLLKPYLRTGGSVSLMRT